MNNNKGIGISIFEVAVSKAEGKDEPANKITDRLQQKLDILSNHELSQKCGKSIDRN